MGHGREPMITPEHRLRALKRLERTETLSLVVMLIVATGCGFIVLGWALMP